MAYTDADEDELVSPSTLWAMATRTPRRNPARRAPLASSPNTTTPTPTPRRTSPRFARARELEKTPPSLPPPKTPNRRTVVAVEESSKLTDSDEKRRKALADELFPPSPPRNTATTSAPDDANASAVGTNDVDGLEEEEEVVADSEVEREREDDLQFRPHTSPGSSTFTKPSRTSKVRQRRRESRRTSSIVFDLDDPASGPNVVPDSQGQGAIAASPSMGEDEGALARRLDQLQLESATSIGDTEPEQPLLPKPHPTSPLAAADVPPSMAKVPRARRRVTISIIDSSSSSSSEDEDAPRDAGASNGVEDVERKSSPPAASDLPATPSDSENSDGSSASQPVSAEKESSLPRRKRIVEGGSSSPEHTAARVQDELSKPWPDDVFENDGVLIYNPTPKKRPVKLTKTQYLARLPPRNDTDSPASRRSNTKKPDNGGRRPTVGGSSLRVEVDLTCDTSDEDNADAGDSDYRNDSDEVPTKTPSAARGSDSPSEPRLSTADRSRLPLELIRELDRAVFRQVWNGLRIVKGASCKTSKKTATVRGESVTTTTHHATVELSTKVTDTASKLRHTLAHELCHLAAWAIDGEMKPPHGAAFKRWAKRVMIVRPDIEVTTTHAYEIVYKYRWKCVSAVCGKIFGRHSASIDPATHGCPCGARIVPIDKDGNPKPGYSIVTATGTIVSTPKSERKKSKWVEFLQSEGPLVRKENPSLSQPDVFKVVAKRWQSAKEQAQLAVSAAPERVAEAARLEESLEALRL
ncbi:hypothetical protein B0A53_04093 [Rhodotorula sp. CCFEE 5036]|nr:hypothetical protein B0A53_04093 [Rhodotorula sp. CCFEE 5036]